VTVSVATHTQCNQVVHHIAAELAPGFQVMDLQVVPSKCIVDNFRFDMSVVRV
jgi:hypothetical protein